MQFENVSTLPLTKATLIAIALSAIIPATLSPEAEANSLCRITVVEKETGWPVPLVELKTVHHVRFVSDNAGVIAFDLPELMGRQTWFTVSAPGYEVPQDGFGNRGVCLTPEAGDEIRVELSRTCIAKRLGRLTGSGLFAESQKLGSATDHSKSLILGCDSVQNAVHRGKMFWVWGDTSIARYPLGIFNATGATTPKMPFDTFEPPIQPNLNYFRDDKGAARAVANMEGPGPTWLDGFISLPDKSGRARLVASYSKIGGPLEAYERGFCVWNDDTEEFEHLKTFWTKSAESPESPPTPSGHPTVVEQGDRKWVFFGNPLPILRCPATFEDWQDPATWEQLKSQEQIPAVDGEQITPHSGSIAWNDFRKRWVTVFMQDLGKPSPFGELWYAEADDPMGPWGPAVKILSHENYTFYNPRLHPEFTPRQSPILLFEGTYTQTFSSRQEPTPRYDYNQILYRLDLDDPQLAEAQAKSSERSDPNSN